MVAPPQFGDDPAEPMVNPMSQSCTKVQGQEQFTPRVGGRHSWRLREDDRTFCRSLQHLWDGWELSLSKSPDHCHGCDTGVKLQTGLDAASSLFQLHCKQRRATFCFLEIQRKK